MAAFLSGEMKDTVQMNPAGAYGLALSDCGPGLLLNTLFSQSWSDFSRGKTVKIYSAAGPVARVCGSRHV